jgi:hypothetical protein
MREEWDKAKSKKQLFDLACNIRGLQYIAESIYNGWGLTSNYIEKEFGQFLNGRCVFDKDGYTSAIYCRTNDFENEFTVVLVIDSHCEIEVNRLCEIYLCNSAVKITGTSNCVVYAYNSEVTNLSDSKAIIKERK